MSEILAESTLRDRNVTIVPSVVRDIWNIAKGERIRWELTSRGDICVCRVVSKKINNKCGGGNDEDKEVDSAQH